MTPKSERAARPTTQSSVVRAPAEKAEHDIPERVVTIVPVNYFDRLLEGIDRAEPSPGLVSAVERARRDRRIG